MPGTHSKDDSVSRRVGVDPITLQLIRGSLRSARLECELIIERTAMSAFIREKKDYTVSFLDRKGEEIYGETMGSDIMGCVWEHYPPETMHAGDVYWYNDPYISRGSITHTPDMVFITPVFFEEELVAYCHSFAHFWDLAGPVLFDRCCRCTVLLPQNPLQSYQYSPLTTRPYPVLYYEH